MNINFYGWRKIKECGKMGRKGIGYEGKSLLEILNESERKFRESGRYYAIDVLTLKKKDPIKYEVFYSRLLHGCIAAREAARHVAASPVTREVAELCCSLMTPEGDTIAYSTGIVVHTQCMGRVIKWMIRHGYEENPGIKEGDLFECNDMLMGGVHVPDVYTLVPIFWKGELIGWAGTVTHEPDVGAITPGCVPSLATDRFTEGMRLCAEKIGENDTMLKSYESRIRHCVRAPDVWLLDAKARATASIRLRQTVLNIIEEFGIEYYMRAIRELIEEERLSQLSRVKKLLVPGRYREAGVLEILQKDLPVLPWARKDLLLAYPIEIRIELDGRIIIDADGASGWGHHSFNVAPSAMEGGLSIFLAETLAYDGKVNSGYMLATDLNLPTGLYCNPDYLYYSSANSWNPLMLFLELGRKCISQAYFARGYREEVMAGSGGISFIEVGGINQYGQSFGGPFAEAASGSGGRAVADGIDTGFVMWNPESDLGNAEVWELPYPFIYLGRRTLPDSGGYGKFRGGNGSESYYMVWGTEYVHMSEIPMTPMHKVLFNGGLFGGYPGMRFYDFIVRNTDLRERIEKQLPIPHKEGNPYEPEILKYLKGEIQLISHFYVSPVLKNYDLIAHKVVSGCGGYGDPVERDPELVLNDLENEYTTRETAQKIYGVVVLYDEKIKKLKVDFKATEQLRSQMREERKKRGVSFKKWWKAQRERILKREINPVVMEMLRDCIKRSSRFAKEFKEFWALPEDFTL